MGYQAGPRRKEDTQNRRATINQRKGFAMLLLAISLAIVAISLGEDITVNLSKGKLRGARLDYDFGQYYYAFKGIPYARPPVKELRFKPPVEVGYWPDIFDATEDGSLCPQFDISHNEPIGDEDCLSLNVYTPKMDTKKRAVVVPASSSDPATSWSRTWCWSPSTTDLDLLDSFPLTTRQLRVTKDFLTRSWSSNG